MKQIIAIIFVTLYGLALVRPALPLVDYYVQLEAYKARCINKTRPEMKCNGQCILMQRLKAMQNEQPEPTAPAPVKVNFEDYPIGFVISQDTDQINYLRNRTGRFFTSAELQPADFYSEIFHPPLKTA